MHPRAVEDRAREIIVHGMNLCTRVPPPYGRQLILCRDEVTSNPSALADKSGYVPGGILAVARESRQETVTCFPTPLGPNPLFTCTFSFVQRHRRNSYRPAVGPGALAGALRIPNARPRMLELQTVLVYI